MKRPHVEVLEGDGPYLLMVHGILGGPGQWRDNLPELSKRFRPVLVDLLGHARSPAPEDPSAYHPDHYVAHFEAVREELGIERWYLIGQSLGGGITLCYALAHPERAQAHVMTNSSTAFGDRPWIESMQPMFDEVLAEVRREGRPALERLPIHPLQAQSLDPDVQRALVAEADRHDPLGVALTMHQTVPGAACGELLHTNRVPTLLVCGTREKRFEPGRRIAEARMAHLEVAEVDAGHFVSGEQPEAFNRAALDFFARHPL